METKFKSFKNIRFIKHLPNDLAHKNAITKENLPSITKCFSNERKKLTIDMRSFSPDIVALHSRVLKTKNIKEKLGIKSLKTVPIELPFNESSFTKELDKKERDLFKFYMN